EVMPTIEAIARIDAPRYRRKCVLPAPFAFCGSVLARQGIGQPHSPEAGSQVPLVNTSCMRQLRMQTIEADGGQHGSAILAALAMTDQDLASGEVDVLDPQTQAFHQAQSGAVEQARHQPG